MEKLSSSYKDPSGFLYRENGVLYRRINPFYQAEYDHLMKSGLYSVLVRDNLLIPHKEISPGLIQPEMIPFISYPYEWCFSQLKDAALTTLEIQKQALRFDMTLKDATAYNIQFRNGRPVFIDTLSFTRYRKGDAWIPYRQFCRHFLAPLMLMSYTDVRCQQLLRIYLDGLPLDLVRKLLPVRKVFNSGYWLHILAPSASQQHPSKKQVTQVGQAALTGLLDSLEKTVKGLHWKPQGAWVDYAAAQEQRYLEFKKDTVSEFLDTVRPQTVWDLGANTGVFSRLCSASGINVIALDSDPACIERLYLQPSEKSNGWTMPLVIDLANPSASSGWANKERASLPERCRPDTIMALALVHHLAISLNIPLDMIAGFFSSISNNLIIEFVPKEDPQAQKLLASRQDIFADYNQKTFEQEFGRYFDVLSYREAPDSGRKLYLMRKKS